MNNNSMNSVAGTASSSARSNCAPMLAALLANSAAALRVEACVAVFTSVCRINECALGWHVHTDLIAQRGRRRCPHVKPRSRSGDDIDKRIASRVFDIVDACGDRVCAVRSFAKRDFLGPHRDGRARARSCLLARADELNIGTAKLDDASFLMHD